MPRPSVVDLTNQRFGHLVALRREGSIRGYAAWRCRCDCGQELVVRGDRLRNGFKKSCGVAGHRWRPDYSSRAGLTGRFHSEYSTFRRVHERCKGKHHQRYPDYGGRGIKVCPRWSVFKNFLEDMGPKPTPEHTIERVDVNGDYEPANCRWATSAEQRRNMRSSVYVEHEGKRVLLLDLVEKIGVDRGLVYQRLKLGWPLAQALSVPKRRKRPNRRKKS